MDVKKLLSEKKAPVEAVIGEYTSNPNPKVREMLSHPFKAGGKRVRPALLLLSCEAVGGDPQKALPAAASVEILHTFTLVHDDIMDHDLTRRGQQTVHARWGEEMGIVVGDTLYSIAFKALMDCRKNGVPEKNIIEAFEVFTWASIKLHQGQIMDMLFEERPNVTVDEYLDMVDKKTGALIEASVRIGSAIGGGTKEQSEALGIFGSRIGTAFQIKDDVLGLTADESELGKPVGSDIRRGKRNILISHALAHAKGTPLRTLKAALKNADAPDEEINEAIQIIKDAGSFAYAEKLENKLYEEALAALRTLPPSSARDGIEAIGDFIIKRSY
ncbi:Geranylgeranyl diphosphate synthase [uncultured archaeon]|nr:Geranylgeranyl diphosphate synthase [uncultured archaeon]